MSLATSPVNRIDMAGPGGWNEEPINDGRTRPCTHTTKNAAALWIVQGLLAAVFLFAGSTKLILPIEVLASMGSPNQVALPGWFLRFVGLAEVLGAIGLILPRFLHIRPRLTPLAAMGLVIIMIGATSLTLAADGFAPALFPMVVGFLAGFVAYRRWTEHLN